MILSEMQQHETTRRQKVRQLLKEYIGYTTTPGIGRYYTATETRTTVIWSVCMLLIYIGFAAHTYVIVDRYLQTPLLISLNRSIPYRFPDVYLCNYNPTSISRLVGPVDSLTKALYREGALDYRSLQFNIRKIAPIFLNDPFKNWTSVGSINFNSSLSPAASQLMSLYRKLQAKIIAGFYKRLSNDTECRVTLGGTEYSGSQDWLTTYNSSIVMGSKIKHVADNFSCIEWNSAAQILESLNITRVAGLIRGWNLSDADRRCRSPRDLNLTTVLMETNWTSRTSDFYNGTDRLGSGPYCFFLDSWKQLTAFYCGVPFCKYPSAMNCRWQNMSYTGTSSNTVSGKPCLTWNKTNTDPYLFPIDGKLWTVDNGTYSKPGWNDSVRYTLYPDNLRVHKDSYCRQIKMFEFATRQSLSQIDPMWRMVASSDVPSCITESTDYDPSTVYMELEQCTPPKQCYQAIGTLSRVFKDTIGKAALLRSFGNDLSINLIDCTFNGVACTSSDFLSVVHPELGLCHLFTGRDRILKPGQSQAVTLDLKLLADKLDSFGKEYEDIDELEYSIASDKSAPGVSGFMAMLVPQGSWPNSAHLFDLKTGHRTYVTAEYNEFQHYENNPTTPCVTDAENVPVTYAMSSWIPNPSLSTAALNESGDLVDLMLQMKAANEIGLSETSRTFPVVMKDDCVYRYIVSAFIKSCGCLPTKYAVPVDMVGSLSNCFNFSTVPDLLAAEICYKGVTGRSDSLRAEALKICLSPCHEASYKVTQSASLWPQQHSEDTRNVLQSLTDLLGFPTRISKWRSINSLYFAQRASQALEIDGNYTKIGIASASDAQEILAAARSSIMWVTIAPFDDNGELIEESEAYPLTQLFSDLGGNLGLWSGICCVTIAELLELLVTVAVIWLDRRKQQQPKLVAEADPTKQQDPCQAWQ